MALRTGLGAALCARLGTAAALTSALVLAGLFAAPVLAQEALAEAPLRQLFPGQRVRVRSPRIAHWEQSGRLLAADAAGLRLGPGGEPPMELAWGDVEWLRVERRTRGAYWEGGFVGLLVGLLVAEGIVAADRDDGQIDPACGKNHCYDPVFWVAVGAAGAGAGAGVGTLLFKRTLWEDVPLPGGAGADAETGLAWTSGGAELRFRLIY